MISKDSSQNKRIAKNTLFLYFRMILVMGVTFFTSRVILQALGVEEYGVYSVVGGLAFSFGFFSSSLSNASQRFLCYAHGKGEPDEVKRVFNASSIAYILIGGSALVIGALAAAPIISNLSVPDNLIGASYWVYYMTLLSLAVTLTATVFDSVLIARENMRIYAYLSILEAFGKLGIAYAIMSVGSDKLIWYSCLFLFQTLLVKGLMVVYCVRKYPECRVKPHWEKSSVTALLKFIGWNGIGAAVHAINDQGISFILNVFFGPVVNAAKGIAYQVNGAINNFSSNFFLAMNPQITKHYAAGNKDHFTSLLYNSGKFSFALLWLLILPVMLRRDYILNLWLAEVPDYTSVFLLWVLIYSLVNIFPSCQWIAIRATGNIRNYLLFGGLVTLSSIPIAWLLMLRGFAPSIVFQLLVLIRVFYLIVSTVILKRQIGVPYRDYILKTVFPSLSLVVASLVIIVPANLLIADNFLGLVGVGIGSVLVNMGLSYFLLLSREKRRGVKDFLYAKFKR